MLCCCILSLPGSQTFFPERTTEASSSILLSQSEMSVGGLVPPSLDQLPPQITLTGPKCCCILSLPESQTFFPEREALKLHAQCCYHRLDESGWSSHVWISCLPDWQWPVCCCCWWEGLVFHTAITFCSQCGEATPSNPKFGFHLLCGLAPGGAKVPP